MFCRLGLVMAGRYCVELSHSIFYEEQRKEYREDLLANMLSDHVLIRFKLV
jgi:hypothetical protein